MKKRSMIGKDGDYVESKESWVCLYDNRPSEHDFSLGQFIMYYCIKLQKAARQVLGYCKGVMVAALYSNQPANSRL